MTDRSDVINALKSILANTYAVSRDMSDDTRLYHDLGLRGVDAVRFLETVFREFRVDQSGFEFKEYFKGEHYSPADFFRSVTGREDRSKRPLTLRHLADVCVKGHWFPPR